MERVITSSPSHCTLLVSRTCLIGLTLYAKIHDMVPANGAIINDNIPGPEGYGIPLLDHETFLLWGSSSLLLSFGGRIRIHVHRVCHGAGYLQVPMSNRYKRKSDFG